MARKELVDRQGLAPQGSSDHLHQVVPTPYFLARALGHTVEVLNWGARGLAGYLSAEVEGGHRGHSTDAKETTFPAESTLQEMKIWEPGSVRGTGHQPGRGCAQQSKQRAISCLRWQRDNATSLGFTVERNSLLLLGRPCPQTHQAWAWSEQLRGVPVPSPDSNWGGPQELGEELGRAKGHHVP